ncbi:MAG: hypothetical protein RLO52_24260 [Sandaracinaceae bacterium]|nr:MAG: hypothetical protein EVA89_15715 [Sandaracinaceae bacterium]
MESITVMVSPEPTRTRLLAIGDGRDVLKAVLPPVSCAHPRAVVTVLEGLSLWTQRRLSVVLAVDEEAPSFCDSTDLCDVLGYGTRSLHFEVGVAVRQTRRARRRIDGVADFRDLRVLRAEVER